MNASLVSVTCDQIGYLQRYHTHVIINIWPVRKDCFWHVEDRKVLQRSSEQGRTHLNTTNNEEKYNELRTRRNHRARRFSLKFSDLLQTAVAIGQIESFQDVWVTQEAVKVLWRKKTHTNSSDYKNSPDCSSSVVQPDAWYEMQWRGRLHTGRSSPRREFPDRSRCVRVEATIGLAQRAWQRLFTPENDDNNAHLRKKNLFTKYEVFSVSLFVHL